VYEVINSLCGKVIYDSKRDSHFTDKRMGTSARISDYLWWRGCIF
jgi:hypothetical protein